MTPARNRLALSCVAIDFGLGVALDEWHIAIQPVLIDQSLGR